MKGYPINDIVQKIGEISFTGNIVPLSWTLYVRRESGKADANGILLLADIVYWYRPVEIRDEISGTVLYIRKKFKADLLQRSYEAFANQYGLSKRQVKASLKNLERLGIITIEHRTIEVSGKKISNVTFIGLNYEVLKSITHPYDKKTSYLLQKNVIPITKKRQTNTETTQETTQEGEPDDDYKKRVQDILIDENGKEHSERLVAERKQAILEAMQRGEQRNTDHRHEIQTCFGITPNWKTKTHKQFLQWLAERDPAETIRQFARWWYDNDWRGQKGQPPSINQIQENWKRAFDDTNEHQRLLDEQFPLVGAT